MSKRSVRPLTQDERDRLNLVKLHLCQQIRRSMARQRNYSATVVAIKLGTSRACVSRVQRGVVEELTFNQLFGYLVKLEPHFTLLVGI